MPWIFRLTIRFIKKKGVDKNGMQALSSGVLPLEANLTYQHFSQSSSPNIIALNAIMHLYFQSAKVKEISGQK